MKELLTLFHHLKLILIGELELILISNWKFYFPVANFHYYQIYYCRGKCTKQNFDAFHATILDLFSSGKLQHFMT